MSNNSSVNNIQVNGIFGTSDTPIELLMSGVRLNSKREMKDLYKTYQYFMEKDLEYGKGNEYKILPFSEFKKYARAPIYRNSNEFSTMMGLLTKYENGDNFGFEEIKEQFDTRINRKPFGFVHLNFANEVDDGEEFQETNLNLKLDSIKLDDNLELVQVELSFIEQNEFDSFSGANYKRMFNIVSEFNNSILERIHRYNYKEKKRFRHLTELYKYLRREIPVKQDPNLISFEGLSQNYMYFNIFITDQFGNRFNIHPRTSIKKYTDFQDLFQETYSLGSFTSMDAHQLNLLLQSYTLNKKEQYEFIKEQTLGILDSGIQNIFGDEVDTLNLRMIDELDEPEETEEQDEDVE